jgi:hypothetical protein
MTAAMRKEDNRVTMKQTSQNRKNHTHREMFLSPSPPQNKAKGMR